MNLQIEFINLMANSICDGLILPTVLATELNQAGCQRESLMPYQNEFNIYLYKLISLYELKTNII